MSKTTILLVYVGSRIDRKGNSLNNFWLPVTQEQYDSGIMPNNDVLSRCYGKTSKKLMGGTPGNVYSVTEEVEGENSSIFPEDSKFIGVWKDQEQITKWQIEHRTAVTTVDLRKRAKTEGSESNFMVLMPFREKYRSLVSQDQRAALVAQMIAFVTAR